MEMRRKEEAMRKEQEIRENGKGVGKGMTLTKASTRRTKAT